MAGVPFVIAWAEGDSAATLKAAYLAEPHGRLRPRRQALWLLRQGHPVAEVAVLLGVGKRTVARWLDWYRHEGGVAGVTAHRPGGRGQRPHLTADQQEQLAQEVSCGQFRTAREIGAWITATFGVTYRPSGVSGLLARLYCHPKVPRPLHERADPAAQAAWKKGGWQRR